MLGRLRDSRRWLDDRRKAHDLDLFSDDRWYLMIRSYESLGLRHLILVLRWLCNEQMHFISNLHLNGSPRLIFTTPIYRSLIPHIPFHPRTTNNPPSSLNSLKARHSGNSCSRIYLPLTLRNFREPSQSYMYEFMIIHGSLRRDLGSSPSSSVQIFFAGVVFRNLSRFFFFSFLPEMCGMMVLRYILPDEISQQ